MVDSLEKHDFKNQLRRQMRAQQKKFRMHPNYAAQEAQLLYRIQEALTSQLQPTDVVGAYWPMTSEVDIRPLFPWLQHRSILALPVVQKQTLTFRRYQLEDPLLNDSVGIPAPTSAAMEQRPTYLLMPLLAFDAHNYRLGQGGGYYDRYLAHLQRLGHTPQKIGIAFSWQRLESISPETHDISLDHIICEVA